MGGYFPTVVASLIIDVVLTWAKPCISVLTHSQEESDCLTPNSCPYIQVLKEWAPQWVLELVSFHVVRSLWLSNRKAVPPPALTLSQGSIKEVILVQDHYFKLSFDSITSRFLIKVWRFYDFRVFKGHIISTCRYERLWEFWYVCTICNDCATYLVCVLESVKGDAGQNKEGRLEAVQGFLCKCNSSSSQKGMVNGNTMSGALSFSFALVEIA